MTVRLPSFRRASLLRADSHAKGKALRLWLRYCGVASISSAAFRQAELYDYEQMTIFALREWNRVASTSSLVHQSTLVAESYARGFALSKVVQHLGSRAISCVQNKEKLMIAIAYCGDSQTRRGVRRWADWTSLQVTAADLARRSILRRAFGHLRKATNGNDATGALSQFVHLRQCFRRLYFLTNLRMRGLSAIEGASALRLTRTFKSWRQYSRSMTQCRTFYSNGCQRRAMGRWICRHREEVHASAIDSLAHRYYLCRSVHLWRKEASRCTAVRRNIHAHVLRYRLQAWRRKLVHYYVEKAAEEVAMRRACLLEKNMRGRKGVIGLRRRCKQRHAMSVALKRLSMARWCCHISQLGLMKHSGAQASERRQVLLLQRGFRIWSSRVETRNVRFSRATMLLRRLSVRQAVRRWGCRASTSHDLASRKPLSRAVDFWRCRRQLVTLCVLLSNLKTQRLQSAASAVAGEFWKRRQLLPKRNAWILRWRVCAAQRRLVDSAGLLRRGHKQLIAHHEWRRKARMASILRERHWELAQGRLQLVAFKGLRRWRRQPFLRRRQWVEAKVALLFRYRFMCAKALRQWQRQTVAF
jgi:hypothetical protein